MIASEHVKDLSQNLPSKALQPINNLQSAESGLQILFGRCTICPRTRVDAINRSAALDLHRLMGLAEKLDD